MKPIGQIALVIFLWANSGIAQKFSLDTNYVERFRDKITVVAWNSVQHNSLSLERDTMGVAVRPLSYPTYRAGLGLTFSFKGISFSFGTNEFNFIMKDQIDEQKHRVGKTTIRSYAFTWNPNRFRIELYYKTITGFHERNRESYDPSFGPNSIYYQYPEMQSVSYGTDIMWTFNGKRRFSIGAPYSYTTRQKKSAGSFMFYFSGNKFSITSPQPFIPQEVAADYGEYADLTSFNGAALSWGAGYGYTIVIAKVFYINTIVIGRVPFMWKRYETASGKVLEEFSEPEDLDIIGFAIGRAAIGVNFKQFFISSYVYADMYDYTYRIKGSRELSIVNKNVRGAILAGYRFNKPKKKQQVSSF